MRNTWTTILLSAVCLTSCVTQNRNTAVDWAYFQKKYDDSPPSDVPALVQQYFRKNQAWPTNKQDLVAFDAQHYGPSNSVDWSLIGDVKMTPCSGGDLNLLWQSRETGFNVTGSIAIGQPSGDTFDIQKYFTAWRAGDKQTRWKLTNVDIITKVIWREDKKTVEALLGPPDKTPPVPEDWTAIGLILDYITENTFYPGDVTLSKDKMRVLFDTEGRCLGAEGKVY